MRMVCLFVSVALAGCSTYSVRRAALVPHLAPTPRNGQPLDGQQEVSFGSAAVVSAGTPTEGDRGAGIELPRIDLNGALRFALGKNADLGFVWDQGLDEGSQKIAPDQPSPKNGDVYGGGLSFQYSVFFQDSKLRLGLTTDVLYYSVPYVEYRTCVTGCEGMPMLSTIERGRRTVPVVSLGVIPSYRFGRVTVYGGMTARNHPTIDRGDIEDDVIIEDEQDVYAGPFNLVASLGVDVAIYRSVRASLQIYQPLTQTPVAYRPTVGLGVSIPIGER
jgi:hypothetical protein